MKLGYINLGLFFDRNITTLQQIATDCRQHFTDSTRST